MCAKACSGRPSTVKGLDTMAPRLMGGVDGDELVPPPPLLLLLLITVVTAT